MLTASQMTPKQLHMRRQSGTFSWGALAPRGLLARLFWMGMPIPLRNVQSNSKSSIDMDIEGGSQIGFVSFLTALRNLMNGGNKPYVVPLSLKLLSNSLYRYYITAGSIFELRTASYR